MGGWGGLKKDKELIAQWQEDIVGDWLEELTGVDLLFLRPITGRVPSAISLRADGTAATRAGTAAEHAVPSHPEAPFPETWELSEDRVLSLVVPIPPMPQYGMPDWTRERMRYDVLAITDLSLTLSDRRCDGETVTVWRRVNHEEYNRRKAAAYSQALETLKRFVEDK
jgi:hypothetical protein